MDFELRSCRRAALAIRRAPLDPIHRRGGVTVAGRICGGGDQIPNGGWRRPGTSRIPAGRTVGIGWPKGRRRSSKPRSRRRRAINPISLLSRRRPHRKPIRCPRKPPVFARLIFARPIFAQWNPIRRSLSNRGTLGESTNRRSRRRTRRWRRRQNSTGWRRAAPSLRKPWNKATPARYRFAIGDAIAHRQIWWTFASCPPKTAAKSWSSITEATRSSDEARTREVFSSRRCGLLGRPGSSVALFSPPMTGFAAARCPTFLKNRALPA